MELNLINANYKYDTLAAAMQSRQIEYFHYDFDKKNFENMLLTLPAGDYRNTIQKRLEDTMLRIIEVQTIYDALQSQIDNQVEFEAAVVRLQAG